jgi:hypothetical protein
MPNLTLIADECGEIKSLDAMKANGPPECTKSADCACWRCVRQISASKYKIAGSVDITLALFDDVQLGCDPEELEDALAAVENEILIDEDPRDRRRAFAAAARVTVSPLVAAGACSYARALRGLDLIARRHLSWRSRYDRERLINQLLGCEGEGRHAFR